MLLDDCMRMAPRVEAMPTFFMESSRDRKASSEDTLIQRILVIFPNSPHAEIGTGTEIVKVSATLDAPTSDLVWRRMEFSTILKHRSRNSTTKSSN